MKQRVEGKPFIDVRPVERWFPSEYVITPPAVGEAEF